tara:strand:+ start:2352 stop:3107 length:756 start_codon:yes stop_codon:yes gene_type:complete
MSYKFIDTNKIFVVDDVAPEWLYNSWVARITEAQRWKYGMAATRQDEGRFFVLWVSQAGSHRGPRGPFNGDHEGIANYFNDLWQDRHLPNLIPDAVVTNIHRVHFNGQFPTNNKLAIHLDWDMLDMWTMVYYLDGNDGDTLFYENPEIDELGNLLPPKQVHRVEFKKNRAVFFPSIYWHAAENPTNDFRISLAFNYQLNRCEINKNLRNDRGIIEQDLGHPDLTDFLAELDGKSKIENMHKLMQENAKPSK